MLSGEPDITARLRRHTRILAVLLSFHSAKPRSVGSMFRRHVLGRIPVQMEFTIGTTTKPVNLRGPQRSSDSRSTVRLANGADSGWLNANRWQLTG